MPKSKTEFFRTHTVHIHDRQSKEDAAAIDAVNFMAEKLERSGQDAARRAIFTTAAAMGWQRGANRTRKF